MNDLAALPARTGRYAWIIVAACGVMVGVTYGLNYSFAVFFKPLAEHFQWSRETVSLVYSAALVFRGRCPSGPGGSGTATGRGR